MDGWVDGRKAGVAQVAAGSWQVAGYVLAGSTDMHRTCTGHVEGLTPSSADSRESRRAFYLGL